MIRVVKAAYKFYQRALTGAIWSNNRCYLSGRDLKTETVQRLDRTIRIAKRYVLKFYSCFTTG